MSGVVGIIFGVLVIAAVVYLLIKQYETRMVLLGAGFLMAIASLKPLTAFDAFSTNMVTSNLIQNICSVMGFALVMRLTECDRHLIHALAKVLIKIRPAIIPGAIIATFLVNTSLISAAGCAAAVGAILIPLMISLGVAPATAASAVMLGTFGSMLSPGLTHNPIIAKIANIEIMEVIKGHMLASVVAMLIGAISLTVIAYVLKEDKGYVDPEYSADETKKFKVNPLYAILPLLPVVILLICNMASVREMYPWAKSIATPHAMLFGAFLCMLFTRTNPTKATKSFFEGAGKGYGDIMGIIIAAGVFVAGMKSIGLIDAFIKYLQETQSIANIAATYGPFLLGVVSGSGDAAALAFNNAVTPHAATFGLEVSKMGSMAALAGSLGRTMSPIAGATIICATLAKVNPFEIAKRNAIGMIIASIVSMILLLYM